MKKYNRVKTIQLGVFILLAVFGLLYIFRNEMLYQMIAESTSLKVFFGILWVLLFGSFIFLYVDFFTYANLEREYKELELTIFSDPATGMANRCSCDAFIEPYLDKPLPDRIGCITFDIINLADINKEYGYLEGNVVIREFSGILQGAAHNVCFVGRNGGNKFLALFEDCNLQKLDAFLSYVNGRVNVRNAGTERGKIQYKYGVAFQEGEEVKTINQLIALANRRTIESYRTFVDRT